MQTIPTMLKAANGNYVQRGLSVFEAYGDREALVAHDGRRFTYREAANAIRDTAALFWREGLRPGMTICFLMTNPAEAYFGHFAAHLIGCRTANLNRTAPVAHSAAFLELIRPDALIYETLVSREIGRELAKLLPSAKVLSIGADDGVVDMVNPPTVRELPFDPNEITNEPESIFQSSGTTAVAKLIRHGSRFFENVPAGEEFYRPADGRPIRYLGLTGAWHPAGQAAVLLSWFTGGTLVNLFPASPEGILRTIAAERITTMMSAPSTLYAILDHPALATTDLSSVTSYTLSAAPTTPSRLRQAAAVFGSAINVAYGMGELPFIAALSNVVEYLDQPEILTSCGKPWGDAKVEIRDDFGQLLAAGEIGDVWVTGGLLMVDYFANEQQNLAALRGGWLRTTDMGYIDEFGYIYLIDRRADMINVSGDKIFSRPIEDALAEHPGVAMASVVAVPDPEAGEIAYAYVIPVAGAQLDPDELKAFVAGRLNERWSPQCVELVAQLPMTDLGKVDKKALRARHRTA